MGTRNLTIIQLDGKYKVAQYGQWDGYPECGGIEALTFARKLSDKEVKSHFESNLRKCRYITEDEIEEINDKIYSGEIKDWQKEYPQLSRDTGRDILDLVLQSDNGMLLQNEIDFAADSLFCEWAWVIDLDDNRFEAYRGFNTKPLESNERFSFLNEKAKNISKEYYPIYEVAEWDLNDLPDKKTFLETFKTDEDDKGEEDDIPLF